LSTNYDYLIVLDFEATCWENSNDHEIIEFPSVVVDIKNKKIINKIEQFVKPSYNPKLSPFCKNLTSISQADVDGGISLQEAIIEHYNFMQKYPNSIIVTCGDWDLKTMLPQDASYNKIYVASCYKQWINLKVPFCKVYKLQKSPGMVGMLNMLKIKLEGTHHRGIDDCTNIAKIAIRMLEDGWIPAVTYKLSNKSY
jgi:ERI1 exoribonuclease 3